ncbi:MAG: 3-deoxy-7-phosphoheptulonate synthase [Deltaproteobacteria bacterium]|nr:3-deoxy-7-phosphoheptulonate synthase [Deltaproteobacteria bacterium]
MIVHLRPEANPGAVQKALVARGLWPQRLEGIGVQYRIGSCSNHVTSEELLAIEGVAGVAHAASPHPLVDAQPEQVQVAGVAIGGGAPAVIMAGPCSIESQQQIDSIAARLGALGVSFLRGGAFKPRTSPYSFQGHGSEALLWQRQAADRYGLKVVTEALAETHAQEVSQMADLVQIGSRNMQNTALLKVVAGTGKPILLKRDMAATVEEWLLAAEYCLHHGAASVIFCERGIRSFDPTTRYVLDLASAALLSKVHRQPVIVDPSHGTGRRDLIPALSHAALAAGAAGLMIETHDDPGGALSDGPQALPPEELRKLLADIETAGR